MFSGIVGLAVAKEVASAQIEVQQIADRSYYGGASYEITYDVSSRGEIKGDLENFRHKVAEIFVDARGWSRAGVKFTEVEEGGRLHMVLASPSEVKKASPSVCSSELSCHVNETIYINDDRWNGASEAYRGLGVSVPNYQTMVVNHEVGHFLGHNHMSSCGVSSGVGSIMIDKAANLGTCLPTYWPLPNELWVKF
ncbi:MAG: DUF3152 domain-containing protein [Candidatus Saccharibacteria bacterium]|nr:DUF3152 domain-containing protein [Candidatus Saccharibacteria bacterium]